MNSRELTRDQIEAIENRLVPALGHLTELMERLSNLGLQQDRLSERTIEAQVAMQCLLAELRAAGFASASPPSRSVPKRAR